MFLSLILLIHCLFLHSRDYVKRIYKFCHCGLVCHHSGHLKMYCIYKYL
uniref:Uncharacterized protein n=1 Tax=Anguilla anguilla TaxID=7936 RepID=A0A0E9PP89_ANGAN